MEKNIIFTIKEVMRVMQEDIATYAKVLQGKRPPAASSQLLFYPRDSSSTPQGTPQACLLAPLSLGLTRIVSTYTAVTSLSLTYKAGNKPRLGMPLLKDHQSLCGWTNIKQPSGVQMK